MSQKRVLPCFVVASFLALAASPVCAEFHYIETPLLKPSVAPTASETVPQTLPDPATLRGPLPAPQELVPPPAAPPVSTAFTPAFEESLPPLHAQPAPQIISDPETSEDEPTLYDDFVSWIGKKVNGKNYSPIGSNGLPRTTMKTRFD